MRFATALLDAGHNIFTVEEVVVRNGIGILEHTCKKVISNLK